MDKPDNFYELLGVERNASDVDIAQAYHTLVQRLQVDVTPANEAAITQQVQSLSLACNTLLNPELRKKHDEAIVWYSTQQRLAAEHASQLAQRLQIEHAVALAASQARAQSQASAVQGNATGDPAKASKPARFALRRPTQIALGLWALLSVLVLGLWLGHRKPGAPQKDAVPTPATASATAPLPVAPASDAAPAALLAASDAPASNPQPLPAKPVDTPKASKGQSTQAAEALQYQKLLKRVEAEHPELNPRSPAHRPDLVAFVANRMQVHQRAGFPKHKALEIAVRDLETQDVIHRAIEQQKAPKEKPLLPEPAPVLDKGGHTGFDPKCRWVTPQDWSCK